MLVNCPRCGFSQPKDQYCAQCGIDMQSFKPKEVPLLNKILGNAGLQIALLFIAAIFVGQYIFHSQEPQSWVQKITHFKGFNKSAKAAGSSHTTSADFNSDTATETETSSSRAAKAEAFRNREFSAKSSADSATAAAIANQQNGGTNGAQDLSSVNFKITYGEISTEMLAKWVTDSSNLGLYQILQEYSAGIIYDFKKRGETLHQNLKTADLRLNIGATNSNLSGIMSEDGSQMMGLVAAVEYKANDNEVVQGTISITRSGPSGNEVYPAEFALPKGAVFFMIGTVKRTVSTSERAKLDMPPFQIFKSPDFMTRKTEFVIILEPEYK